MTNLPTVDEMQTWNKRYKLDDGGKAVIDTIDGGDYCTVHGNEAYNLCIDMNKLYEENIELKEILKHTYEIQECETCKHNQYFNWLDPATMEREYDSKCGKGLHYDDEVHDCEEYELDLEMFKKRVKR